MRKIALIVFLFIISLHLFAQNMHNNIIMQQIGMNTATIYREGQINLKLGDVDKALVRYSEAVKQAQKQRNSGHGVDAELLAEYAYTLALNHDLRQR